jgi:hypothetical protein
LKIDTIRGVKDALFRMEDEGMNGFAMKIIEIPCESGKRIDTLRESTERKPATVDKTEKLPRDMCSGCVVG